MRQFILPEDWDGGQSCLIEGGTARYLRRVLRLRDGDRFVGMDRSGGRWLCSVLELGAQSLRLGVEPLPAEMDDAELADVRGGRSPLPPHGAAAGADEGPRAASIGGRPEPSPPITLVQALPRGAKMDLIVRQAAETGVCRVIPLVSRRCLPLAEAEAAARGSRWERIAREGLQQSGSTTPTRVTAPVRLQDLERALGPAAAAGTSARGGLRLLLHETPLEQSSLHEYLTDTPVEIAVCVGPEGGFADDEVAHLEGIGFLPLHFAGAILRTETAALFAVAAVETVLSERSTWMPRPL